MSHFIVLDKKANLDDLYRRFCSLIFTHVQVSRFIFSFLSNGQVRQLQENAAQLRTVYAGENAAAIVTSEQEVMRSWKELLTSCEDCRLQITTTSDRMKFLGLVRDLISWMDSIICQIGTGEKPRYVENSARL